jgi:hypothetical protein
LVEQTDIVQTSDVRHDTVEHGNKEVKRVQRRMVIHKTVIETAVRGGEEAQREAEEWR